MSINMVLPMLYQYLEFLFRKYLKISRCTDITKYLKMGPVNIFKVKLEIHLGLDDTWQTNFDNTHKYPSMKISIIIIVKYC